MFFGKIQEISRMVREVEIDAVVVPEGRVRRVAYDDSLRALADSIREHGVIEPLLVRRDSDGVRYILIAGERRLRAAEVLGMASVPCVSIETDEVDAAVLAIIENLHREDLNLFEEAAAITSLINLSGMTQEQCARRLSVSQSYVANKMRLLKLSAAERETILTNGLSERHARALLRLSAGSDRTEALETIVTRHLNVAQTEEYIEALLCAIARAEEIRSKPPKSEQRQKIIVKDIRLFYNSIDHAVDVIKKSGIAVESTRTETDEGVRIEILLPRQAG